MTRLTVVGDVDDRAVQQIKNCTATDSGEAIAAGICADGHVGYSQPIGGFVAYEDHISPSGVGYDIGCGNKAVATNVFWKDIRRDLPGLMDEIARRISFGMGVPNDERVDDPILDRIRMEAPIREIAKLQQKAAAQLGTVGGGNHYVDLFRDGITNRIWVGVHFGSRGFGHTIASGFLAMARGKLFTERVTEGEMDSPPVLIRTDSPLGYCYLEAMTMAGEYAHAGRNAVCEKVLEILGAEEMDSVHNHHNFAWREKHFGKDCWVIRKGCTPAFPDQRGFVGATMGEASVILRGVQADAAYGQDKFQEGLLFSTVHGAGRVMSRTAAAGKTRRFNAWECNDRDCSYRAPKDVQLPGGERIPCPDHPGGRLLKRKVHEQVRAGSVDWPAVTEGIRGMGIELRGAAADEAPEAYKRLDEVLAFHAGTVEIEHYLLPVGVAMAGADVFDPFKD